MQRYSKIALILSTSLLLHPSANRTAFAMESKEQINIDTNDNFTLENGLICNKGFNNIQKDIDRYNEQQKQKQLEKERLEQIRLQQKYYDNLCFYDPYDLTEISNISVDKAYQLLEGTTYQTWDMAQSFVDAEKLETPINAIFLISLTRWESFHGKSDLAKNRNNICSIRLNNGDWKYFNNKLECVEYTKDLISNYYLDTNGRFYRGLSIWNVGYYYCEGNTWADNINILINEIKK